MAEIRVNVSSVGSKGTAQATNNAAQYWAEKAREWAISENPVSMEDNSSKYYAGKAKEYAQSAQQYKNDTQEIADTAESNIDDLTSDFSSLYTEKSEALQSEYSNYSSSLEAAKTSAITSIQTTGTEVNTSITTASTSALSDITTAKNTAVEDIQDEADTQISNIQSTGFYMRDGRLYYVDSEGQEQEFKSGEGLPLLSIRPALYVDESLGLDYYLNGQLLTVNANLQGAVNALKSLQAKNPSLFTTEEEWQAEKEASDHGQVGKLVLNYAQAEVEKQCSIFGGEDILTSEENYWLVEKAKNDVEVGDLAYPCDSSGTKTGDDAAAITAVWTGTYTGEPIISITESGNNGKSFYSEVTLTETVTTDEIVSFRLPAVINIQGVFDLQNAGLTVEAGLPNIKSENIGFVRSGSSIDGGGAIKVTSKRQYAEGASVNQSWSGTFALNAADSSSYYKDGATVQSEAIQYPWVIRLATGQETEVNIRNDIELNNPYTLFDSKYSETPLYNSSWLLSSSMYYSGTVYVTAYEALMVEYNSEVEAGTTVDLPAGTKYTKRGLSVKLSTEEFTDFDFVLNTSDETFRLPLKNGTEGMFGGNAVVGNGMALGLTNGSQTAGLATMAYHAGVTDRGTLIAIPGAYGASIGITTVTSTGINGPNASGVTTDPAKSGLVVANAGVVPDGWALYFYVGETVQNANLINAGRFEEQFSQRKVVVETYKNGFSWYRVWSDGWIEQGGHLTVNVAATNVQLLKQYKDATYTTVGCQANTNNAGFHTINVAALSATHIQIRQTAVGTPIVNWYACGY